MPRLCGFRVVCGMIAAFAWGGAASADTIIDTTPANTTIASWGPTSTFQYGQVVTVPTADYLLKNFSFTFNSTATFNFNADVAAWNGVAATGPLLFSSAQVTADVGSYHTYAIDTGGLALTPGQKYVLFFDAYGGGSGGSVMAARDNDPYGAGTFVYANNVPANLASGPWLLVSGQYDAAFNADFASPVPLPNALAGGLGLLGAMGVAVVVGKKRQAHRTS